LKFLEATSTILQKITGINLMKRIVTGRIIVLEVVQEISSAAEDVAERWADKWMTVNFGEDIEEGELLEV
jgi:hypothetical protein